MMDRMPLIGVTAGLNDQEKYHTLHRRNMESLLSSGGMPVMLPLTDDPATLAQYVERLDGFCFSGGCDVDPQHFGQWQSPSSGAISPLRDAHELALASLLIARQDKPVLGICRGMQVLNIALGGDIYQDLPTEFPSPLMAHRQKQPYQYPSHRVQVACGSLLHRITGMTDLQVNSLHHQAVKQVKGWLPCAESADHVIEAAYKPDHPFFLGVQWHPEHLFPGDEPSRAIFRAFVDAC